MIDLEVKEQSVEKGKKLKKKKKRTSKQSSANNLKSSDSTTDPFEAAMELIEKDSAILNKLPPELKQQVFYILLIRGETLIKEKKTEESIEKAVEYFVKAVALVSSPTEVLMSYEQTLPAEIFKKIISSLQNQNSEKTKFYFETLKPETGMIKFSDLEGPKVLSPTGNSNSKQWMAVAEVCIEEGTVLMSEEPDIAICTSEGCCDYCFKAITDDVAGAEKVYMSDLVYCSKYCQLKAQNSYGKYIAGLEGTSAYAHQQLVNVVHETKCYAPLLMLRYIATLLEDELSRQKQIDNNTEQTSINLFAHYDYLRPAYRVPRDSDKAEAVLIRTILEPSHSDISQFLSDEIYVAMKSTVMFNAIGSPKQVDDEFSEESKIVTNNQLDVNDKITSPSLKHVEPIRLSGSTSNSKFFGLYHSFAHIAHSCSANCELIPDESIPRRLKLISKRPIKEGEKISLSYAAVASDECKKEIIERDFYITCECK